MKMASRSIDIISKKTNSTCSTLFFLISNKTNLHVQHAIYLSLLLFCTTTTLFCSTKSSNFHVTNFFMGELSYVLTQYFVSCVQVRFYFSLPLIFTLLAAPSWPLAFLIVSPSLWIFMFFFLQNSSVLFSITRSSSFSVIHASVNFKNNVEKDTTLLFSLSFLKSRRPCDFVAFRLPYLLIELFYIGMPVVWTASWTVDRSVGRCTVTWLPNFLGWVVYIPHFLTYGGPLRALRARELRYYTLHRAYFPLFRASGTPYQCFQSSPTW